MPKILIVGGGYAGFYTAWKLEKRLRAGEAEITIVDPRPYMTYLPFLPEVAAGSIEPRHAVVSPRRHLKKSRVIRGKVTGVTHANRTATIEPVVGEPYEFEYDQIVVTAGSVSRTFPIPGVADTAIGLKSIEEAAAIRDRILGNFDRASELAPGPERDRLLTVVVVGGGFAGIEVFSELRSFASALLKRYPQLAFDDVHFHLIEAAGRIMPEVSLETTQWVLKNLAERGAQVHLDTQLKDATGGVVQLSTGESFESDLIIWTAGVMANPEVVRGTDLPVEDRGRIRTRADLRVGSDDDIVDGAWAAGDVAAVADITGGGLPDGTCVPNAQHAVRQGKQLAKNILAVLRGEEPTNYEHKNLGAVAGLGLGVGVFQSGKIAIKGFPAWVAHRGYHGLAIPSWERKLRVFGGWWNNFWLDRDIVSLETRQQPRAFFEQFASRPKPPAAPEASESAAAPSSAASAGTAAPVTKAPATKKPAARKPAAKKPAVTTSAQAASGTTAPARTTKKSSTDAASESPAAPTTTAKATAAKTTAAKVTAAKTTAAKTTAAKSAAGRSTTAKSTTAKSTAAKPSTASESAGTDDVQS